VSSTTGMIKIRRTPKSISYLDMKTIMSRFNKDYEEYKRSRNLMHSRMIDKLQDKQSTEDK